MLNSNNNYSQQQQQQQQSVMVPRHQTAQEFQPPKIDSEPCMLHGNNIKHIFTVCLYTNPAEINFDHVCCNAISLEIIKTRIVRSEYTCEYYRNVPFLILSNNFNYSVVSDELNVNFELLERCMGDCTCETQPLDITFKYDYNTSHYHYIEGGVVPYILESKNYTVKTLMETINSMTFTSCPKITMNYDDDTKMFYFTSTEKFYMFPSNAYTIVGIRRDTMYSAQFDTSLQLYVVYAERVPSFTGSDVIFINCKQVQHEVTDPEKVALCTVYLPSDDYPYNNNSLPNPIIRPIQTIKRLHRLTFTMYTDLTNKLLYQNNGNPWYVEFFVIYDDHSNRIFKTRHGF